MRISHLLFALSLTACAAHEAPPGRTAAEAPAEVSVAVASVLFEQNCPDPPDSAAMPERERRAGAPARGCVQSRMQLSLHNPRTSPVPLRVAAVRLLDASGKQNLATITSRRPSLWSSGGGYQPWDQKLAPGATLQVAYNLSDPTWSNGYVAGPHILEVDVEIAGETRTVRSQEFRPRQMDMVET